MKLSIVLSTQPAQFQAATFKGDLETNLQQIASLGYDGVELAIRDPKLVDLDDLELTGATSTTCASRPSGPGRPGERKGCRSPIRIRRSAAPPLSGSRAHIPVASRFGAVIIIGLIRGIVKPGVDASQAMDWLVEALQECSDAARPTRHPPGAGTDQPL